jgi:hypothetical protein
VQAFLECGDVEFLTRRVAGRNPGNARGRLRIGIGIGIGWLNISTTDKAKIAFVLSPC